MTAVIKRPKPRLLLAVALVAFMAEEIWSLSTLGGQSVSSFGGPATSLLVGLLFSVGLLVLCVFLIGNSSRHEGSRGLNRGLLIALAIAAHLYSSQELLQLLLGDGHAVGLHGFFGHGAWIFVAILVLSTTTIAGLVAGILAFRRTRHLSVDHPVFPPAAVAKTVLTAPFAGSAPGHFDLWSARGPPSHA